MKMKKGPRLFPVNWPVSFVKKIMGIFLILSIFSSIALSFDFTFSAVKLNNFSNDVYKEVISKFRIISLDSEIHLPETPYQKIENRTRDKNKFILEIHTGIFKSKKENPLNEYLGDTRLLDYKEKEVQNLKKNFVGSDNVIKDIEKFVYNYIINKDIGIPIIPATQIIKNKTGDCTEHTVLTISLLRSLGIPSRAIVGMLLSKEFGDLNNVFVYHMWAEVFIDGKWKLVDATRPGKKRPNLYIAFSYHHLKTEMPLSYLKAISSMKNFSVEYISK